ncbi:MAG: efflux RND transporter periplasmic adaptor subunit, partial [Bacteroidales bacterium]|nr:efflux RND transporter periplasmic adaptor subunit [Bacteroidales bacterium]
AEARKNLMEKNTRLHAPFAGIIAAVYVEEGENYSLMPSGLSNNMKLETGIVRLISYDPVKITISVNEKLLAQLHKGQEAHLRFDAFPDTVFLGKVNYIGEELSTMSHSAEVELLMENRELLVKPGMFAHVSLLQKPTEAVFVPINSVQRQSGTAKDFVYVLRDNSARRMEVEKGIMLGDKVSITGLRGDETVVVNGKSRLTDGAKVQIK